ncbi:hypothetical protein C0Q70_07605 [Pomacea canaliculata]|uniref:Uncharacterized protein n=1 Tax=Pomacea canaliculata TaxID=400727 RepID=A0A2T7PFI4_POMCA|nr:hypothetical protein C0Q70_07605 [Pomacea canaliculata]
MKRPSALSHVNEERALYVAECVHTSVLLSRISLAAVVIVYEETLTSAGLATGEVETMTQMAGKPIC